MLLFVVSWAATFGNGCSAAPCPAETPSSEAHPLHFEKEREKCGRILLQRGERERSTHKQDYCLLAAATPQQQKQMLGERLFPLVEKLKFDLAAKITGMLLEMDNSELLLLLESPESLAAKVEEAVEVLKVSKTKVGGQESLHPTYLSTEVAVN